ncbi:MAG TPA: hypothetical protein VE983_01765 [Solirubrobacteraceae bacterium]|nr:hypothetical protein [Solirubrobacteraceae bacterium]
MADETEQRIARNEGIFREINEGIRRGRWPGEEDSISGFRCECASLGCTQMLPLTFREYERVRQHPRRFIVAPGHERLDVEAVVETQGNYLVVQKVGEAGRSAEANDPRT